MAVNSLAIPVDIVNTILDNFALDKENLKSCALVSHSFLSHCRKLLFASIRLHRGAECRSLYAVVSANPSLATCIHRLELVESLRSGAGWGEVCWFTIEVTLVPLLKTMHNLHTFTLYTSLVFGIDWHTLPQELRNAILSLSAPSMTFGSLSDLPLAHFGRLHWVKHLCLCDIVVAHNHALDLDFIDTPSAVTHPVGHLETLTIKASSATQLIRTLTDPRSHLRLSGLKRLTLRGHYGFEGTILEVAGATLEQIVWDGLGEEGEAPFTSFPRSFSALPALCSLTIGTMFADGHQHDPLLPLTRALSEATPNDACALSYLELRIDFSNVVNASSMSDRAKIVEQYVVWRALDQALTRQGVYMRLEKVVVILAHYGALEREVFLEVSDKLLPGLSERDILSLVYTDMIQETRM